MMPKCRWSAVWPLPSLLGAPEFDRWRDVRRARVNHLSNCRTISILFRGVPANVSMSTILTAVN
jgi:hypothetical protein